MSKHTPGPWEHDRILGPIYKNRMQIAAVNPAIAIGNEEEYHANAHLISQAPAMYEDQK